MGGAYLLVAEEEEFSCLGDVAEVVKCTDMGMGGAGVVEVLVIFPAHMVFVVGDGYI